MSPHRPRRASHSSQSRLTMTPSTRLSTKMLETATASTGKLGIMSLSGRTPVRRHANWTRPYKPRASTSQIQTGRLPVTSQPSSPRASCRPSRRGMRYLAASALLTSRHAGRICCKSGYLCNVRTATDAPPQQKQPHGARKASRIIRRLQGAAEGCQGPDRHNAAHLHEAGQCYPQRDGSAGWLLKGSAADWLLRLHHSSFVHCCQFKTRTSRASMACYTSFVPIFPVPDHARCTIAGSRELSPVTALQGTGH